MTRFLPKTIRARLVLLTMFVMGIVLVVLGIVVNVSVRGAILSSIDQDLAHRSEGFALMQIQRLSETEQWRGFDPGGPRPGDFFRRRPPNFIRGGADLRPRFIEIKTESEPPPPDHQNGDPGPPKDSPYDQDAYEKSLRGETVQATIETDGGAQRIHSEPVKVQGKVRGVVQVAYPVGDVLSSLDRLHSILLRVIVPLGTAMAGIASLYVVSLMLRSVRQISDDATRIGAGNLSDRLVIAGADEFAGLAKTLNGMLDRLETAFMLERETGERLARTVEQQRRFTADASHELKTPLATIKAYTGLLKMGELDTDEKEGVQAIDEAADRMRHLVGDLLLLARADAGGLTARAEPVDLFECASAAVVQLAHAPGSVELKAPPRPLRLIGNGEALTRLFVNLLDNALKYSGSDKPIEIRLSRRGDVAEIAIIDRGVGISPEHLPKLFDRFYRPDTSRTSETGGTGLGLAICKEIAHAHEGTIELESRVGQGSTFTVILPLPDGDKR